MTSSRPDGGLSRWGRLRQRAYLRLARSTRGMTLGVRGVVIGEGKVLLVRHSYVPGWYFPGGGVDVGETMGEALARELVEEARVRLTGSTRLLGVYLNRNASPRDHVALYLCREFTLDPQMPASREIVELGFFPLDRLPEGTTLGTQRRLAEIAGAPQTEDW